MKKTYRLKCIHRDTKWEGAGYTYVITPIQRGLSAIQTHLHTNNFEGLVEFLVKEVDREEAIFTLKGKKKHIQEAIHTLLCDTNLADYFKVEERGY